MGGVQVEQRRFAVAARVLNEAYGDLRTSGRLKEDPEVVAAALEDVRALVKTMQKPVAEQAPTFSGAAVIELLDKAKGYGLHACSCPWCLMGGSAPSRE